MVRPDVPQVEPERAGDLEDALKVAALAQKGGPVARLHKGDHVVAKRETRHIGRFVGAERFAMARALLPNVRPQDLDRMKPWSVLALLEARGESGGEATMDARLQRMAAGAGKRVLHLESLEDQLKALDCVPASEHVRVLDVWRDPAMSADIEYVECDIRDRAGVARAMAGIDVVHHNVALVPLTKSGGRFWEVNVDGSRIAAEAAP